MPKQSKKKKKALENLVWYSFSILGFLFLYPPACPSDAQLLGKE